MTDATRTLYLVDGTGYFFRAFHAIQHLSNTAGTPTNAVFGVTRMLVKLQNTPDMTHVAVVVDPGGPNFRHTLFPEYKANRPPPPEDLLVQIPLCLRAIEALGLPLVSLPGFEADDVIASLARAALAEGFLVVIVSADKDLMQLVGDGTVQWDPMKDVRYDAEGVRAKLGVPPGQVTDLLGLMGDASDNIPGVTGIGAKTAVRLLEEHGSLEGVLKAARVMKFGKLRTNLIDEADLARLSQKLATVRTDLDVPVSLPGLARRPPDRERLDAFFAEMGFHTLRRELTPQKVLVTSAYKTVLSEAALAEVIAEIRASGRFALDVETTSLDPMQARLVGLSLCPAPGRAYYVPVAHTGPNAPEQLPLARVCELLGPVLSDPGLRRYGQNTKYDALVLVEQTGLRPAYACDAMLASYVLDPGRQSHGLDALAQDLLGHQTIRYQEVAGRGRSEISFAEVEVARATEYSGEDADATFRLCELLLPRVEQAGLARLFHEVEMPLSEVLLDMERAGVQIDPALLAGLSQEVDRLLGGAEERIYALAGHTFNIASPIQLRSVLFEELGLPVLRKTKSGPSTDQEVLEELALQHDLPAEVLSHRSLAKLRSTYLEVLPRMIHPRTGRIHARFNQAVTATGRLSSSDPNLQNIPVRTELGRRIREAFVAPPGHGLLSADYSQVELRILAHVTGDEALRAAFASGEDIHATTAAELFSVPIDRVTSEMRSRAKAVNFGIIYGQGAFALSRQLGISRAEAEAIISAHQARFPKVSAWVERTHAEARRDGAVTTILGRKRLLPDIGSPNRIVRANAERMAQNTPIQGSAADIIKLAMIALHRALQTRGLKARMVLQVHDELVLEVPEAERTEVEALVREKMEGALRLDVPLTVDIGWGRSWAE